MNTSMNPPRDLFTKLSLCDRDGCHGGAARATLRLSDLGEDCDPEANPLCRHAPSVEERDVDDNVFSGDDGNSSSTNPVVFTQNTETTGVLSCTSDEESGLFGQISSTQRSQVLSFDYQIETTDIIEDATMLQDQVLPIVKERYFSVLVPIFLDCAQQQQRGGIRVRRRRQQQRLLGHIVGLAPVPKDQVRGNVACDKALADPSNKCFVVEAFATLYASDDHVPADQSPMNTALDTIREYMKTQSQELQDLHEGIVGVQYYEPKAVQPKSAASDDSLPPVAVFFIGFACAAVLLASGCIAYRQYRRRRAALNQSIDDTDAAPLGIHPRSPEESREQPFDRSTQSSWDVMNSVLCSSSPTKDLVGISPQHNRH